MMRAVAVRTFNLWGGADSEDLSGEYIHSKGIFGLVERPQP